MAESNSDEKKPAANKGDNNDVKVVMFADTRKRLRKCVKFVRQHIHFIRTFSVLFAVSLCSGLVRNSYTFTGYVPKVCLCRIDIFGICFSFPEDKSLNLIDITITYGPILDTSSTGASFLIATILTTPLTLATWRRRRILMTPPHLPSTSAWESLVKCWAEMKTDTPASIASQRFQSQVWSRAVSTSARYAGEAQTLR